MSGVDVIARPGQVDGLHGGVAEEVRGMLRMARAPRVRGMREFCEAEIKLPTGPAAGLRFRVDRAPWVGLWFDELDRGAWTRTAITAPAQTGKSLVGYVVPAMYYLFELGEDVVCGVPVQSLAGDKWEQDFAPVIRASRYRDQIPNRGPGSRGGTVVDSVTFRNGASLKFMTGGGKDKSKAGYTTRVVLVTETDGMDKAGEASQESNPIDQLEARTRSYGARKRVHLECTVSTAEGRIWQEYSWGTRSRILMPCPGCGDYVGLERENLKGWQEARSVVEARERTRFHCPECDHAWSEAERAAAAAGCVLVHGTRKEKEDGSIHWEYQKVSKSGKVSGPVPATNTLGFRVSAGDNLFLTAADLAEDEWKAQRAEDEVEAQLNLSQFVWAIPPAGDVVDAHRLESGMVMARLGVSGRGVVPEGTACLTAALDVGLRLMHWVVLAHQEDGAPHVVEYGRIEVPSVELGDEAGILNGLHQFRDFCEEGWVDVDGELVQPGVVLVDAGYRTDVVYQFTRQAGGRYYPAMGFGASVAGRGGYRQQVKVKEGVPWFGDGVHMSWQGLAGVNLVNMDADFWKSYLFARMTTPLDQPGALTLYRPLERSEHLAFAKHMTAERMAEEYVAGRGLQRKWVVVHRNNHWLDGLYMALVAGYIAGIRVETLAGPEAPAGETGTQGTQAEAGAQEGQGAAGFGDGDRPYLVTER